MAQPVAISLTLTPAPANATITVQGFEGIEAISRPFVFRVFILSSRTLAAANTIGCSATLSVETGAGPLKASGLIFRIEAFDAFAADTGLGYAYCLEIQPRLCLLDLHRQNRILGTSNPITMGTLISDVLAGTQDTERGDAVVLDTEPSLSASYETRDFVVQYDESDLAFLSRQCERAGIFYFFKQGDSAETLVYGDSNLAFPDISTDADATKVPFGKRSTTSILAFGFDARMVSKTVALRDYDPSQPQTTPSASADVLRGSHGISNGFGSVLRGPVSKERAATLRAQEITNRRLTMNGRSNNPALRAGHVFELTDHPDTGLNGRYLLTEVRHAMATTATIGFAAATGAYPYSNSFTCVRFLDERPYRPPLVTPVPKVAGLHTARVDGPTWCGRAEIDADGRYKVTFAHPCGTQTRNQGSCYVRKASLYAGANDTGMEFPLLPGTEVVIAYLNGDIDFPVILGAVPNGDTRAVVKETNQHFNRLRTQAGLVIEMFDGPA
ncbi:type VI secretion system tip protein TssI/VgrG [Nostoc sp. NIES-2111]